MYKIIDTHCHIFPEKIAEKATGSISEFYGIGMRHIGNVEKLIKSGSKIGVEKYVVHSTATKVEQVKSINDFLSQVIKENDCLIGYGTLHPDMSVHELDDEVDRIINLGLKGIKLHPDFQRFYLDSEEAMKIFGVCEGKLPVLVHAGDQRHDMSSPSRFMKAIEKFQDLKLIVAHLGGYSKWDEAMETIIGKNIYIDTCSSLSFLSPEKAANIIRVHGYKKVLFATDFPMWDHEEEFERFLKLPLDEEERKAILYDNFIALLGGI